MHFQEHNRTSSLKEIDPSLGLAAQILEMIWAVLVLGKDLWNPQNIYYLMVPDCNTTLPEWLCGMPNTIQQSDWKTQENVSNSSIQPWTVREYIAEEHCADMVQREPGPLQRLSLSRLSLKWSIKVFWWGPSRYPHLFRCDGLEWLPRRGLFCGGAKVVWNSLLKDINWTPCSMV